MAVQAQMASGLRQQKAVRSRVRTPRTQPVCPVILLQRYADNHGEEV